AMSEAQTARQPWIVLMVDHLATFLTEHLATRNRYGTELIEGFLTIFAQGRATRVVVAASIAGGRTPNDILSRVSQRLVLKLADLNAYGDFGIARRGVPRPLPGRGVWLGGDAPLEVQVGTSGTDIESALATVR